MEVINTVHSVFAALELVVHKNLNMAVYRLPDDHNIRLMVQKDKDIQELSGLNHIPAEGGFVIAPFSEGNGNKTSIIRPDLVYCNELTDKDFKAIQEIPSVHVNGAQVQNVKETRKDDFIRNVRHTIDEIKEHHYDKVVLSRVKIIRGRYLDSLSTIFRILCESYPGAFVYMFRMNDQCWMGASPEPLICSEKDLLFTVSLAGTRPYSIENLDVANWNRKEKEEQEYVTNYIEKILTDFDIKEYVKTGPYTKIAGKLLHLRTDFRFPARQVGNKLLALITSLHPTSAVCGIPMQASLKFIRNIEEHDREYYSGFLGPVTTNNDLQLFVNLRCMKVLENQLALFVGGGITSGSVPEEEWEETEIKAETLLSVVQQFRK